MDGDITLRVIEAIALGLLALVSWTQKEIIRTLRNHFSEDLQMQREIAAHMATTNEILRHRAWIEEKQDGREEEKAA